jgi:hypothetical protein
MSTPGASADQTASAAGASAASVEAAEGGGVETTQSAGGASAILVVGPVIGSTPSSEGQPVVLLIDVRGDALEIDPAGDPLLVQAGVTWTGRSASEIV